MSLTMTASPAESPSTTSIRLTEPRPSFTSTSTEPCEKHRDQGDHRHAGKGPEDTTTTTLADEIRAGDVHTGAGRRESDDWLRGRLEVISIHEPDPEQEPERHGFRERAIHLMQP